MENGMQKKKNAKSKGDQKKYYSLRKEEKMKK